LYAKHGNDDRWLVVSKLHLDIFCDKMVELQSLYVIAFCYLNDKEFTVPNLSTVNTDKKQW